MRKPPEAYRYAQPELRAAREAAGLSQSELASAIGVPLVTFSRIERRLSTTSPERQKAFAAALGRTVDELFAPRDPRNGEIVAAYNRGESTEQIAKDYGLSRSRVARILAHRDTDFRPKRHLSADEMFAVGARSSGLSELTIARRLARTITIEEAVARYGLRRETLRDAIVAGRVPGAVTARAGKMLFCRVDPRRLEALIASRPVCAQQGCRRPPVIGREMCWGHLGAMAAAPIWKTWDFGHRISVAKTGKPRPDVRKRMRAMFDDPQSRADWGLKTFAQNNDGRLIPGRRQTKGATRKSWNGRKNLLAGPTKVGEQKARDAADKALPLIANAAKAVREGRSKAARREILELLMVDLNFCTVEVARGKTSDPAYRAAREKVCGRLRRARQLGIKGLELLV